MNNDLIKELGTNFIEYAVAVNTDRAIPDAKSGLKPVAKRILYGAFDSGYSSNKAHVKCANIVGNVMADWHPHGDSSIYGALVRLSQPWVMRYPLIDFHGSNGNRDGDGPAAYRYTEARLDKLAEDGMLRGIKKDNVDFIPNYQETKNEPITLPAIFPNLLCNPNTGIGVAMACNWLPHNLREVAQAIYSYMDGNEPTLPGPDFPTGGIIINKNDLPDIIKSGRGSIKLRGKYNMEENNIVFYEIPYGVATEEVMNQIGIAADEGKINGISDIRNESNRKGFRLVIECEKNAAIQTIITKLFAETDLQKTISYNQVALIDKTPTELGLKDCIEIYVEHNTECLLREFQFDLQKTQNKLEITSGLLKALEDIDNIIALIKKSESSATAKVSLMDTYGFSEAQAKAIVDMKLGRLAGLEKIELQKEHADLLNEIERLTALIANPEVELKNRLQELVNKYGDDRRTELAQITVAKEDKEIEFVEPEKCVVVMTESGLIKRVPSSSFRTQKRNGKGVKTQDDITSMVIRTNTIDSLMVFSNKGKMYRLLVNDIPVGTNTTKGQPVKSLVPMEGDENPSVIYSIYRDTEAKFVFFATKKGIIKKTPLEEYLNTKKRSGLNAINIKEDDELVSVSLVKDETVILLTKKGTAIHFKLSELPISSRIAMGVKGITLNPEDEVIAALPVRDSKDELAIFSETGLGKRIALTELPIQKRAGKGLSCYKNGIITCAALVNNEDTILVAGNKSSLCIACSEIPSLGRGCVGNLIIKDNKILSVSKV